MGKFYEINCSEFCWPRLVTMVENSLSQWLQISVEERYAKREARQGLCSIPIRQIFSGLSARVGGVSTFHSPAAT
jgi:hypothetical protein